MSSVLEYAKSTLAKALGPQGPNLPFTISDPQETQDYDSIFTLHKGIKKDDGSIITVFVFDVVRNMERRELARNALKKARTIRHPQALKFIDGTETDTQIIIGTELVTPLSLKLRSNVNPNFLCWGLYKISVVMKFLNLDCQLLHGNLRVGSIYTTPSGEWKLGGFDTLGSLKDDHPIFSLYSSRVPNLGKYLSPEVVKGQFKAVPPAAIDGFAFACLIHEVFNGSFNRSEDIGQRGSIPLNLYEPFRTLLNNDFSKRLDFSVFLEVTTRKGGYFDNDMIWTSTFLEEINMKESSEKEIFLKKIDSTLDTFPIEFSKFKVLPELLKAIEFGGAGAKALTPILKIGSKLSPEEFNSLILPTIINLLGSQDRNIRVNLLENLECYISYIPEKLINDKVFKNLASGFTDANATLREQTLKSVLLLAPKLNERILNNDLLRYLMKLQTDDQPGIRTNTVICIADPFPPSKISGLMAFAATIDYHDINDISSKVMPVFCRLLLDPERTVRVQAFKNMNVFLKKVEEFSNSMAEPKVPSPKQNTKKSPILNVGSAWTNWAISTVSPKSSSSTLDTNSKENTTVAPSRAEVQSHPEVEKSIIETKKGTGMSLGSKNRQNPVLVDFSSVANNPTKENIGWDDSFDIMIPTKVLPTSNSSKNLKFEPPVSQGWSSNITNENENKKDFGWESDGWTNEVSSTKIPAKIPLASVASSIPKPKIPLLPISTKISGWDDENWSAYNEAPIKDTGVFKVPTKVENKSGANTKVNSKSNNNGWGDDDSW